MKKACVFGASQKGLPGSVVSLGVLISSLGKRCKLFGSKPVSRTEDGGMRMDHGKPIPVIEQRSPAAISALTEVTVNH